MLTRSDDVTTLCLRFTALREFLRALKCTYEIHCVAHKEISIFKSDRHVSQIPGHVPTRFGSEKPQDTLEREGDIAAAFDDSAARVSCVCIAYTNVTHTINTPAYRSHTRDFEVALLAVCRWRQSSIDLIRNYAVERATRESRTPR